MTRKEQKQIIDELLGNYKSLNDPFSRGLKVGVKCMLELILKNYRLERKQNDE